MIKRIQNKVAESRFTLPAVSAYAVAVWLASGLLIPHIPFTVQELAGGAWVQLVCFVMSAYLMVELNNSNALIRIYSRTVSASFLVMSCMACFLFDSMAGSIVQLCVIAAYTTIFRTYQNKQAVAWTYYAFLCVGMASTVFAQLLFLVPVWWLLMRFQLNSMSWRNFFASLLGLLTPYWFALCLLTYFGNFEYFVDQAQTLVTFQFPYDYTRLTVSQVLVFAFVVVLGITGTIHYWRNSSDDKIRIRQLYGWFIAMSVVCSLWLVAQPQHYDMLLRLLIVNTAPLIAHFLSLTYTRITNIAFYVICVAALLLTVFCLWMPSLTF